MTNEEAIKEIKIIREDYWDEYEDTMPALDMAIKALEQQSEDAISREDALMCMTGEYIADMTYKPEDIISKHIQRLRALPSVQPKPKVGHWIPSHIPESILVECSECGFSCGAFTFNYCPNCSAKMVEAVKDLLPRAESKE